MKKTIIGGLLMFHGTLICLTIITLASSVVPRISEWRGTKLWFVIFGAKDMNYTDSLFLGGPFIIGSVLFIFGFIVIILELYSELINKIIFRVKNYKEEIDK
ncbi:MAG: hypothetical protein ACK4M9_06785 [Anaerobacillus sp.]|uniref:hypothetical protein n=1 Tax=Anaerobacillus sp. TaxID=1872506 RepID=UPI00391C33AE